MQYTTRINAVALAGAAFLATNASAFQDYRSPVWKWVLGGGSSGSFNSPEEVISAVNERANALLAAQHVNCGQAYVNIYDLSLVPSISGAYINGQFTYLFANSGTHIDYVASCYNSNGYKVRDESTTATRFSSWPIAAIANLICSPPMGQLYENGSPSRVPVPGGDVPSGLMWCTLNVPDQTCGKTGGGKYGNPIDSIAGSKTEYAVDYQSPDGLLTVSRSYSSASAGWRWGYGGGLADFTGRSTKSYVNDDDFVGIVNLKPGILYDSTNVPPAVPTAIRHPLVASPSSQSSKEVWVRNAQGIRVPYTENPDHSFSTTFANADGLRIFSDTDANQRWITTSPYDGLTIYNDQGSVQATYRPGGQIQTYARTNSSLVISTPYSGRKLIYSKVGNDNDGVYNEVLLPNGDRLKYDTKTALVNSVAYPDGSSRAYKYGELDMIGTSTSQPSWLTGILDESGARFATFKYNGFKPISTEHAGGVGKYSFNYLNAATVVTPPFGSTPSASQITVNWETGADGERRFKSKSQPGGSGCNASSSNVGYYTDGQVMYQDDFNQHRICYGYTSSSDGLPRMEKARVEGLSNSATCSTVLTDGATLPKAADGTQSRKISTKWHPQWALRTQQAEPLLKTTWVYNGQPDPFNNNQTASCASVTANYGTSSSVTLPDGSPIAVLCKKVEQATDDQNGSLGLNAPLSTADAGAVVQRQWSYTYNQYGQVLTSTDPLGVTTTYSYYLDTSFSGTAPNEQGHTQGDLQSVSNPLGHTTAYTLYDRAGHVLSMTDPNGLVTTYSYWPRGWIKSVNVGGLISNFDYWPTGLLKKATQPDGSYLYYVYDDAHRLTDITDQVDGSGTITGNRVHYTLDNAGNRLAEDVKDSSAALTRTIARTYDALNRLQNVTGAPQ